MKAAAWPTPARYAMPGVPHVLETLTPRTLGSLWTISCLKLLRADEAPPPPTPHPSHHGVMPKPPPHVPRIRCFILVQDSEGWPSEPLALMPAPRRAPVWPSCCARREDAAQEHCGAHWRGRGSAVPYTRTRQWGAARSGTLLRVSRRTKPRPYVRAARRLPTAGGVVTAVGGRPQLPFCNGELPSVACQVPRRCLAMAGSVGGHGRWGRGCGYGTGGGALGGL